MSHHQVFINFNSGKIRYYVVRIVLMQYTIVTESKYIKDLLMADRVEICSRESTDKTSVVCDCFNIHSCDLPGTFNP